MVCIILDAYMSELKRTDLSKQAILVVAPPGSRRTGRYSLRKSATVADISRLIQYICNRKNMRLK